MNKILIKNVNDFVEARKKYISFENMTFPFKGVEKTIFEHYNTIIKPTSEDIQMLGYLYYNGIGTTTDYKKAFELFENAALQGNIAAQNNLGFCYYQGKGCASSVYIM